jgi:hypothetical protein
MDYSIQALTLEDQAIVWEMLRYAAHESSLKSVQSQPLLARYAVDWGRPGDMGCAVMLSTIAIGAAWLRLGSGDDQGFGYISDDIPELAIAGAAHPPFSQRS